MQSSTVVLKNSPDIINLAVEQAAAKLDAQVVAPTPKPSQSSMSLDESELTTPIDDLPSLSSTSPQQSCPDDEVITDESDPTTLIDDFPPLPPRSLKQSRPNNQVTPYTTL